MLEIQSLSVSYRERLALRDVSIAVQPGEVLALIGPNGAGKSTLIRAASGILSPRTGKIYLQKREISTFSPSERARLLAVVPQTHAMPPTFSVYQTVLLGRTPYLGWLGNAGRSDHAIVAQALEQVGIAEMSERMIGELSGGEQQKVLLARALAQSTPILLLDEPTNHLDLRHQASFLGLVRKMAVEKGLAVMVALHDLNLASLFADRVALLAQGTLHALGTPEQVFTAEILSPVYGMGLRVITHPEFGTPLILPDGPSVEYAPRERGYLVSSAASETKIPLHT
jgi:iron complex transport system ATP-binding protein